MYKTIKLKTEIMAFFVAITKIPAIIAKNIKRHFKVGKEKNKSNTILNIKITKLKG